MAMQLTDVLELERENELLRDALHLIRSELKRIHQEYLEGMSLGTLGVTELDEELDTVLSTIDNALQ